LKNILPPKILKSRKFSSQVFCLLESKIEKIRWNYLPYVGIFINGKISFQLFLPVTARPGSSGRKIQWSSPRRELN